MSQLEILSLPYVDDLIAHYQSFSMLPGFVLLESSDRQRGRYDVMAALPYDTLRITRDTQDISDVFQALKQRLPTVTCACDLPFQGGAIGYMAYDFGAACSGIYTTPHPANDMPWVDFGFYDWAIVADHLKQCVHLVAANTHAKTREQVQDIVARWHQNKIDKLSFQLTHAFTPLLSRSHYKNAIAAIHHELVQGRAYQVNYTQPFLGHYRGDPWGLYQQVRLRNKVPYSAFLRLEQGDILSFSPERFLTMEDGVVCTSPIKGTSRRSPDPLMDARLRQALLDSEKNRAENVMIVDLLRHDLGKIAKPGSVQVTALGELQSFAAVHHLVSHIQADCVDTLSPWDVFSACFPGGSITGAPKLEAMRIIHEQEAFARGVYCGSIGYVSVHGRMDSQIAIRTLIAKEETMYLSAGGGIVLDSECDDEYEECLTKIAAILGPLTS